MKRLTTNIVGLLVGLVLVPARGVAFADDISGTITTTWTIFENSRLVGHVMCAVTGAPCIQFGAPGITLKLNGFTMTGQADVKTGCAGGRVALENGISTNGQNEVAILGPGLVQAFRANGILASGGSSGMRVARVTAANNCQSGILVSGGASDGTFERNVLVRNFGSKVPGFS